MSLAEESRLETQVGGTRHEHGRPFHFEVQSQDDRIRQIFGLGEESSLPTVNDKTLGAYYDHLAASLTLPFDALYCPAGGDLRQLIHYVRVTELMDPRQGRVHNNLYGLFCKAQNGKNVLDLSLADLGVRDDSPNCRLMDDYAYWFVNWR
jgi:hypothetical protein